MIYFDNAATYTIKKNEILNIFNDAVIRYSSNTQSSHRLGQIANRKLEEARDKVKNILGLSNDYDVIFNSGASEGIAHALLGYARKNKGRGNEIIAFKNEHPAVIKNLDKLQSEGFIIHYVSCDKDGVIDYKEIEKLINNNTLLVIAMAVNNEVGSINDVDRIKLIVKNFPKCVFFSDATQAMGKININYNSIDIAVCSAHKFGGFIGSGILIKKSKILLEPLIVGGEHEHNYRSGTTPLPLILSTVYALELAYKNMEINLKHVAELNKVLSTNLLNLENVKINLNSFPYIINFSILKSKASVVIEALSNKEIYVSSLSACSSKHNKISQVLLNMGISSYEAENSIRVSFSHENNLDEIKIFIKELKSILESL